MDVKVIEAKLLRNPKYSSAWVENAAKILANTNVFVEETLAKCSSEQLEIINAALEYNTKNENKVSILDIADTSLNATQMRLIFAGQQNHVSIATLKQLVNKDIPYVISNYAVQAAIEGHDMSKYVNGLYDNDQVYEIYAGLHNGIDVSCYDNTNISANIMGLMRHASELGFISEYDETTKSISIKVNE